LVVVADQWGSVHCLDEKTGKQQWTHDVKSRVYGHALVVDGKIYSRDPLM
jgi:outer membrane protein assembly factor BamB